MLPVGPIIFTPFGAKPPGSSNGTHDLSSGKYQYTVDKVAIEVFTDRFVTGVSTINVSVLGLEQIEGPTMSDYDLGIAYVTLYNADGTVVKRNKVTLKDGNGNTSFTATAKNKYYVGFSGSTQGTQAVSFHGNIT